MVELLRSHATNMNSLIQSAFEYIWQSIQKYLAEIYNLAFSTMSIKIITFSAQVKSPTTSEENFYLNIN